MKTCSLRFSNIYGPWSGRKGSVIPLFIQNILAGKELTIYGDGTQTRDFLFVEDLTKGILQALDAGVSGVYQLGTNVPVTINSLLETLGAAAGAGRLPKVIYKPFRPGEVAHNYCDITRARETFGFDPQTPLTEGVACTFDWFLRQEKARAA
jgi:UDP-glucose 4-epimerase